MSLSKRIRFEIFKRDSFTCQYCGRKAPDVVLHADHIIPRVEGGTDDLLNLITSCLDCNLGKGPRLLSDTSAVEKQRRQLEELQERKEQIEMMVDWQRSLMSLDEQAVSEAAGFWSELLARQCHLTAQGKADLSDLIKRFGLQEVLEAMRIAVRRYVTSSSSSEIDPQSVNEAWTKVGGICYNRKRWAADPAAEVIDRSVWRFISEYRKECSPYPADQELRQFWSRVAQRELGHAPTRQAAYELAERLVDGCLAEYDAGPHSSYWSAMRAAGGEG